MNEKSVEGKPCINRESKVNELTIQLYSCYDINMKTLAVVTPPYIYKRPRHILWGNQVPLDQEEE